MSVAKATLRASGSVVEYRLAKARVAGSNPVSRSETSRLGFTGSVFISGFFGWETEDEER